MAKKEKFGKFVLLDEIEASGLGHEYRAAKLGASGLEKIVSILRIKAALSSHPEVVRGLMDQVKFAAQLQNPNILHRQGRDRVLHLLRVHRGQEPERRLRALPPGGLPVLGRPRPAHREQDLLGPRVRALPQDRGWRPLLPRDGEPVQRLRLLRR
jgi:hypothetical protein